MLVLGAVAGWIASAITQTRTGLMMDVVLGIVGSFVGGLFMNFFGQPGVTGFDLYSLVVSVLGAVIAIFIGRAITRNSYA